MLTFELFYYFHSKSQICILQNKIYLGIALSELNERCEQI